ncbi:MAG TPA: PqqD family protein [Abditibacteriaceae bacterium]|jgi:hypothetical protein
MIKYSRKKPSGQGSSQDDAQKSSGKASSDKGRTGAAKAARKNAPTRRELLAVRPVRNPALEWEEEDEQVVLHIKRVDNWKTRLITIFTQVPESRRVVLDPIGTHVWRMLDGQTTFEAISKSLAKEFKLMPREAELSLQQFFKELGRRGYVMFVKSTP